MVNQQTIAGNWNQLRGKLKEKWGKLTDDDLRSFSGSVDQLVGRIQQKTGESRQVVEEFLEQLTEEGAGVVASVRETIQHGAAQIGETAQQGYRAMQRSYDDAERVVQERPGESLAMAFGLGVMTGLGLMLLFREHGKETHHRMSDDSTSGRIARQIRDSLANLMPESLSSRS
jgi:uncharacterized protein YjbJ (UPF0337 family)